MITHELWHLYTTDKGIADNTMILSDDNSNFSIDDVQEEVDAIDFENLVHYPWDKRKTHNSNNGQDLSPFFEQKYKNCECI